MAEQLLRIFIVDDENVIASTLAAILNQSGFDSAAFTNPIEAMESAEKHAPDLLISDVMMPQMTGIDLAIRLKALNPSCKVLLFSGQAATADMLTVAKRSGHDFTLLSKPVYPADLLSALRSL